MKKKIVFWLFLLFLLLPKAGRAQGVVSESAQLKGQPRKQEEIDFRLMALSSYLAKKNSPLADSAADFIRVADEQNLDWRLLPAIAGLESSFGKRLVPGSFNPFGWGGGYIYFESWEDGFETVAKGLINGPYPDNKSPEALGPIYAPPNPKWGYLVRSLMNQIQPSFN